MGGKGCTPSIILLQRLQSLLDRHTRFSHPCSPNCTQDGASLEIINALVTDSLSKHVLVVLAYRDDDVETRPMLDALFVKKSNKVHLRTSSIRVSFFNLESMNIMLSDLLQIDTATVLSLSSLILRKTHGNAYFVFKFLESLQTDGLLFYSNESFRWEWNHDRIQAETNVSENVVSLITSRIRKMNDHVQAVVSLHALISAAMSCH